MAESPPNPWSRATGTSNDPAAGRSAPVSEPGLPTAVHYGPVTGRYGGGHATAPPRAIPTIGTEPSVPGSGAAPLGRSTTVTSTSGIGTIGAWTATTSAQDAPSGDRAVEQGPYAPWRARAGAWLIDAAPGLLAAVVLTVGYGGWLRQVSDPSSMTAVPIGVIAVLLIVGGAVAALALGWCVVDRWIVAGRTGQSFGKRRVGLCLVGQDTAAPIGPAQAFVRDLVHLLDGLTVVGFLWPRWDERRQSLADKLMRTVVVAAGQPAG